MGNVSVTNRCVASPCCAMCFQTGGNEEYSADAVRDNETEYVRHHVFANGLAVLSETGEVSHVDEMLERQLAEEVDFWRMDTTSAGVHGVILQDFRVPFDERPWGSPVDGRSQEAASTQAKRKYGPDHAGWVTWERETTDNSFATNGDPRFHPSPVRSVPSSVATDLPGEDCDANRLCKPSLNDEDCEQQPSRLFVGKLLADAPQPVDQAGRGNTFVARAVPTVQVDYSSESSDEDRFAGFIEDNQAADDGSTRADTVVAPRRLDFIACSMRAEGDFDSVCKVQDMHSSTPKRHLEKALRAVSNQFTEPPEPGKSDKEPRLLPLAEDPSGVASPPRSHRAREGAPMKHQM